MPRPSRFLAGSRILAGILAIFFVVPTDAVARMSCASLAALSLPMPCCAAPATVPEVGPKACCCASDDANSSAEITTTVASLSQRLATSDAAQAKVRAPDGCCCSKPDGKDASLPLARDPCPLNVGDLGAWIAERAEISAHAIQSPLPHARVHSDHDGPALRGPSLLEREISSSPAVGCARRDLLARGVVGLLTDFGIALL